MTLLRRVGLPNWLKKKGERGKEQKTTQLYTEDVMYMCARHTKISKGFFDWELGGA